MNNANMPPDWEPPAPAWTSRWADGDGSLLAGYFAVQGGDVAPLQDWAEEALFGDQAPPRVERGRYLDALGVENRLYIAYWRLSDYSDWWQRHRTWWDSPARDAEPGGYWREIIAMPLARTETLHSTPETHGVSRLCPEVSGPIREHGYPGGMRDRVPISAEVDLRASHSLDRPLPGVRRAGNRVLIHPPENLCVIRSGQNWRNCAGEQQARYLEELQPLLLEGMRYLRDNPRESGCYSMRFVTTTDGDWRDQDESFGLGYATDIFAFENWARSHPTHLAIFDNFLAMAEQFGPDLQLRLWHEVTAIDGVQCEFEYLGCNPATGLLPYL